MKIQGVVREGSYKCPCCTGTFDLNLWNYHHRGDLSCILSDFVVGYETIETWLQKTDRPKQNLASREPTPTPSNKTKGPHQALQGTFLFLPQSHTFSAILNICVNSLNPRTCSPFGGQLKLPRK